MIHSRHIAPVVIASVVVVAKSEQDDCDGPASAPTVLFETSSDFGDDDDSDASEFRNITALPAPPLMPEVCVSTFYSRRPPTLSLVHSTPTRRPGKTEGLIKNNNDNTNGSRSRFAVGSAGRPSYFSGPSSLPPMPTAA